MVLMVLGLVGHYMKSVLGIGASSGNKAHNNEEEQTLYAASEEIFEAVPQLHGCTYCISAFPMPFYKW
jgi:hypothetical protein